MGEMEPTPHGVTEEEHQESQESMEAQGLEPGSQNPDLMKKWEEEKNKPTSPHGETWQTREQDH